MLISISHKTWIVVSVQIIWWNTVWLLLILVYSLYSISFLFIQQICNFINFSLHSTPVLRSTTRVLIFFSTPEYWIFQYSRPVLQILQSIPKYSSTESWSSTLLLLYSKTPGIPVLYSSTEITVIYPTLVPSTPS